MSLDELPAVVTERCGDRRGVQLGAFIDALVTTTLTTGTLGMDGAHAEALAAFRAFNYERIYLRAESVAQADAVIEVLTALTEHFILVPNTIPGVADAGGLLAGEDAAVRAAVAYVAGMTDRFAFDAAVELLDFNPARLPKGIGA